MGHDRLAGMHVCHTLLVLNPHHPAQHDRNLLELGTLPGLQPSRR
jgi:hypothetical protein